MMQRSSKLLIGAFVAIVAVGLAGTAGLVSMYQDASQTRTPRLVERGQLTYGLQGAVSAHVDEDDEDYTPTSQYVEPGADSNEVTLGFAQGDASGEPSGERMDDVEVQEVIGQNQNDLILCYAEGLERDEDMSGRVDFHFRVATDGHVAMVKVTRSELADQPTEDCFVKVARAWDFPATNSAQLVKFDTDFTFAY